MRFLYCGDIVGRSGREAVIREVPRLREELKLDFVAVNGENAAGGFGITEKICKELYDAGVDTILLGNHSWDQREIVGYIDGDPRLLRPINYPKGTPGRGAALFKTSHGARVYIVQVMGRLFMDPLDDPFAAIEEALGNHRLGATADFIMVDVHAEATSEKMAVGHFCDGRASLVAGTHTHVPTADAQVLPGGTAYISDIGMCGDYNSVIGMKKEVPLAKFTRKLPTERMEAADGEATVCAVFVETDEKTGLATAVSPVRLGGKLAAAMPSTVSS